MAAAISYSFHSDNAAGVDSRILAALTGGNPGVTAPYGVDDVSRRVDKAYSDLFEHEAYVFAAPTGTAANGLALGAVTPSYGAIFCHEAAHPQPSSCCHGRASRRGMARKLAKESRRT